MQTQTRIRRIYSLASKDWPSGLRWLTAVCQKLETGHGTLTLPDPKNLESFAEKLPSEACVFFFMLAPRTDLTPWLEALALLSRKGPLFVLVAKEDSERRAEYLTRELRECPVQLTFREDCDLNFSALQIESRLNSNLIQDQNEIRLKHKISELSKADTSLKQREEFLSVCAHDLRSPLALIQSSLSLILNSKPLQLQESQKDLLRRAKRQSEQAINLVKDLLDVMAFELGMKPHYELLPLDPFLQEFYLDYKLQAEQKNIQFHYENAHTGWRVLVDPDRIRQLLQNLFTNAVKFTEPGKNIFMKVHSFTGRRKIDPPFPMLVISIQDEGKGIPQNEMQRIFNRFAQIREAGRGEGRGLGLTVAKQISTLHDGNIWVTSEEGKGSTFHVLFPHVVSRDTYPKQTSALKRILIAEPKEGKRAEFYKQLEKWGYETFFVSSGTEALTYAFHRWPDLIIIPAELSKLNSTAFVAMLKADPNAGQLPILYASENGDPKSAQDILADAYLPLPFKREEWDKILEGLTFNLPQIKRAA